MNFNGNMKKVPVIQRIFLCLKITYKKIGSFFPSFCGDPKLPMRFSSGFCPFKPSEAYSKLCQEE